MRDIRAVLSEQFLVPVVREHNLERLLGICKALQDGGSRVIEITLMSPAALKAISELAKDDQLWIGAGTVMNAEQGYEAAQSGAKFIVSPGICEDLLGKSPVPYIPGVATSTEVMEAVSNGVQFLKLFPAEALGGVKLLKALMGPFPQISWMPTGGIDDTNLISYKQAGALCVGASGKLFPESEVASSNWQAITNRFQQWRKLC